MKYRNMPMPLRATLLASLLLLQTPAQKAPDPFSPPTMPGLPDTPSPTIPSTVVEPNVPQHPPLAAGRPRKIEEKMRSFKFEQAELDIVMSQYCDWTGQIYLKNDTVKATITLKADQLTTQEAIEVVEAILGMNGIVLIPFGEKFLKVVMANTPDLDGQGLSINRDPAKSYAGTDKLVTQIIQLKNAEIADVQTAVQQLMHAYGKILMLERSNSMMITDTESNILRIRELLELIDTPGARIEPHIYTIEYADATEIAAKLNEIITMAQSDQKKATATPSARPGNPSARTPAGVIRARPARPTAPTQASISRTGESSTLIIQGEVKVMADERTNIIIVFSQKENFKFFDEIIKVLDIEVEPAIAFEVVNLEYADAEELSSTLNELVGAASQGSKSSSSSSSSSSRSNTSRGQTPSSRTTNSRRVSPKAASTSTSTLQSLGKLSENTKILADKRTNSILLMGEKADIAVIKNVIADLDVMLEQVMIEAAIFEVTIGDDLEHGIQWFYKNQPETKSTAWNGTDSLVSSNAINSVAAGALTYYQMLTGIDTQLAIKLSASDSNVRLLSTPIVMTTDNTEAKLSIGEQRPVVTSTDSTINSSQLRSNYDYKDIGIQLTVTPRINPQRVVIMEILQKADQVGDEITIDGNLVPVIFQREFEATIAVPDRGTIALGGLINTETRDSVSKIPILGDIPLIGRYLFSSVKKKTRQTELIVLLTPYVLTTDEEVLKETTRRYDSTDMQPEDWPDRGWSESNLRFRSKPDLDNPEIDSTTAESIEILRIMEESENQ